MEFKSYRIDQFINDLAGDLSSPGGGSVAALVMALASSLNQMVYSFTIDKKSFDNVDSDKQKIMVEFSEEAERFIQEALTYMDKDREAFSNLMDCFKLPKSTEEDKIIRAEKIFENTKLSMNVPLELAEKALKFYDNIEFAVEYGNKNLTSDGIVAAILLHSSIECAIVNVKVNYKSVKEKEEFNFIPRRCIEILDESLRRKNRIVNTFNI